MCSPIINIWAKLATFKQWFVKYLITTKINLFLKLGLAQLYLTGGKGVPMDLEAAAKYFRIAADAGNAQVDFI